MRIMLVHPHLDLRGGSERLTSILAHELCNMGHEVALVTASLDPEWFKIDDKMKLYWIKRREKTTDQLTDSLLSVFHALRECIVEFQPDKALVVIQEPVYAALIKMLSKNDLFTALYIHFPYDEEITEENLTQYLMRFRFPMLADRFVPMVDRFFCNSRYTARAIQKHWKRRAVVVYPTISDVFLKSSPDIDNEREKIAIYIARTVPLKQQTELIRSFKIIRERVSDARLILAGFTDPRHGDYDKKIKKALEEHEGVEFLGTVPDEKLLELYRSAKVYVHPRVGEHFGMAPIEAMSQGCPVIVRYPAGLCEVMPNGYAGYWARTEEQFIKYLEKILKMPHREWKKLSRKAIRLASKFNANKFASQIIRDMK